MAKKKNMTPVGEFEMPQELEKKTNIKEVIQRIEKEIKKSEEKAFNVYFYVIDTKGVPSGSLLYIYKMARILTDMGYKVTMLHNEKEFIGVEQWADKKYAELPHSKISDRAVTISPSDFLIIPEIYTDIMSQTRDLPCKRIILLQNFEYMTKIIPAGVHPYEYRITDAIVNTEVNKKFMANNLPRIKTHVVRPGISDGLFRKNTTPKKMIVNFVAKEADDASRIVKPFWWKYPRFKWVTFAQLSNLPQEIFADALRDAAFTIVIDIKTSFQYAALEALKAGSIVLCKVPENIPDWMKNGDEFSDSIVWFDNLDEVPDILAELIAMWVRDDIPEKLYETMDDVAKLHSMDDMKADVEEVFVNGFFKERLEDLKEALETAKNKEKTEVENE